MATSLTLPIIHLNGTSRNELRRGYLEAWTAVEDALDKVRATTPNGRDYYPAGPEVHQKAVTEHRARIRKLEEVHAELSELAKGVRSAGVRLNTPKQDGE